MHRHGPIQVEFVSADLEEDIISRIFRIYNASRVRAKPTVLELGVALILLMLACLCYIRLCSRGLKHLGQQNKSPASWGSYAERKCVKRVSNKLKHNKKDFVQHCN